MPKRKKRGAGFTKPGKGNQDRRATAAAARDCSPAPPAGRGADAGRESAKGSPASVSSVEQMPPPAAKRPAPTPPMASRAGPSEESPLPCYLLLTTYYLLRML